MIDTGEQIRARRKALKMSQGELGKRAGVSYAAISNWENNKNSLSGQNLLATADALGCSPRDLVDAGQITGDELLQLEAALIKKAYEEGSEEFREAARRLFDVPSRLSTK